jgi:squalene synthase HpnC
MSTTVVRPGRPEDVPSRELVMAQMGDENFPVASHLVGRRARAQLTAIYGFARLVDDVGDEADGNRLDLLDWIEHDLDAAYAGGSPEHPVIKALALAMRGAPLPEEPFRRLIDANRQDQRVTRYESFDQLLGYCQLSAAPVGELVLHVFGAATAARIALSDQVCAGLQVTEHIQDIREDYARGRIYMPQEDLRRFGCRQSELGAPAASRRVRELLAFEVARARALLDAGAPLARTLSPRPRVAVAGFIAGGRSALAGIERAGFDPLAGAPSRPPSAFATAWLRAVRGT